jgi:hypothetical protein
VQAGENAGGEDDRAAREDRADDGERFEERGDEDDAERDARVRREDADQRLQVRFQAREPLASGPASGARRRLVQALSIAPADSFSTRPRLAMTDA